MSLVCQRVPSNTQTIAINIYYKVVILIAINVYVCWIVRLHAHMGSSNSNDWDS